MNGISSNFRKHIWEMSTLPNSIWLCESLMGRSLRKGTNVTSQTVQANTCISHFNKKALHKVSQGFDCPFQTFATYSMYLVFSTGRRRRSFGLRERWAMVSSRDRQLRNRLWTSQCPWSLHKSRRLRGLDRTDHFDCQKEVKSPEAAFHILEYSSHQDLSPPISQKSSQAQQKQGDVKLLT